MLTHVAAITGKAIRLAYCVTVETIMFYMGGRMSVCVAHIVPVAQCSMVAIIQRERVKTWLHCWEERPWEKTSRKSDSGKT